MLCVAAPQPKKRSLDGPGTDERPAKKRAPPASAKPASRRGIAGGSGSRRGGGGSKRAAGRPAAGGGPNQLEIAAGDVRHLLADSYPEDWAAKVAQVFQEVG